MRKKIKQSYKNLFSRSNYTKSSTVRKNWFCKKLHPLRLRADERLSCPLFVTVRFLTLFGPFVICSDMIFMASSLPWPTKKRLLAHAHSHNRNPPDTHNSRNKCCFKLEIRQQNSRLNFNRYLGNSYLKRD